MRTISPQFHLGRIARGQCGGLYHLLTRTTPLADSTWTYGQWWPLVTMVTRTYLNSLVQWISFVNVFWTDFQKVQYPSTIYIYVLSLILALPETRTLVNSPLKPQATMTPAWLKKVLWGNLLKLENHKPSSLNSTSIAISSTVTSKKANYTSGQSWLECDYCNFQGYLSIACHTKQLDDQHKDIGNQCALVDQLAP